MQAGNTIRVGQISTALRLILDPEPKPLFNLLNNNYFEENCKPGCGFFFDNSQTQKGCQSIQNRLLFMRCIDEHWNNKLNLLTNDHIRVLVKKHFLNTTLNEGVNCIQK
jgi:hypothetical protein